MSGVAGWYLPAMPAARRHRMDAVHCKRALIFRRFFSSPWSTRLATSSVGAIPTKGFRDANSPVEVRNRSVGDLAQYSLNLPIRVITIVGALDRMSVRRGEKK